MICVVELVYTVPVGVNCTVTLALAPELDTLVRLKPAKVLIAEPENVALVPDLVKPPVDPNSDDVTPPVVSPL